jgi:transcription elongation factor GreA
MQTIPFTKEGFDQLNKELDQLKGVERQRVIESIAEARAHGDLKENAEYHAAREKQGLIEARIAELEDKLSRGEVVAPPSDANAIRFGAWVTLCDEDNGEEKQYRIVGDMEADITNNRLSISSPMGKALLGKKIDDLVEIKVPKGIKEYVVVNINY